MGFAERALMCHRHRSLGPWIGGIGAFEVQCMGWFGFRSIIALILLVGFMFQGFESRRCWIMGSGGL